MRWLVFAALGAVAFALGYLLRRYISVSEARAIKAKAERTLAKAKDQAIKIRKQAKEESERERAELKKREERLQRRWDALEHRMDKLEKREHRLNQRQSKLDRLQNKLEKLHRKRAQELERISGLTSEEAKEIFLQDIARKARDDAAGVIRKVEAQAKEEAERRAREIITTAIQRYAGDQVEEAAVSVVALPNDEMKGRIIGRGGRNIRAFEKATGVNVVVDDTPEAVLLSSFDPVRREIAQVAMKKLILDGRIHPGRIEKLVDKSRQETETIIREEGDHAAYEAGVHGLHPELIKLLGQLKFRTSYGQNVLAHSVETAHLAGMMAAELGADVDLAKKGGLLHDIGKAVDHQVTGPHALIGADIAKRLGAPEKLVNCIGAHHNEVEPQCMEAILVAAADAISGARPGARREDLERYVKRIETLEKLASSFEGVEQSYAIQAGREVRIIVKPEKIDDLAAIQLSKEIAKKVEETLEYPGQIQVTVIRETRAVEYAQ
ncbi:MAG: ribonuclease Y [Chloroflexota bacterium]|nr:ribonuclease Y [Chloroflexota bacterium]